MKKLSTLLFAILIFSACKKPVSNSENDASKKIASIKNVTYNIENEELNNPILYGFETITFDENELEVTKLQYAKDSSLIFKDFYTYFKEKNLIKIKTYTEDDQIVSTEEIYCLNGFKNIKKRLRYNQSNELFLEENFIWKNDYQKVEQARTINDELFSNSVSTFNELKNLVSQKLENKKENYLSNYEWKYMKFDEQNKWLERQEFLNNRLVKIEKREIIYQ